MQERFKLIRCADSLIDIAVFFVIFYRFFRLSYYVGGVRIGTVLFLSFSVIFFAVSFMAYL